MEADGDAVIRSCLLVDIVADMIVLNHKIHHAAGSGIGLLLGDSENSGAIHGFQRLRHRLLAGFTGIKNVAAGFRDTDFR